MVVNHSMCIVICCKCGTKSYGKIGAFGLKDIFVSGIKMISASVIMGIAAKLVNQLLLKYISANLSLLISIAIGAGVYFILILFMGIKEVDNMVDAVKRKIEKTVGEE